MVTTMPASCEITGAVERVGNYGFTLEGREGWISKFAEPRPELPCEGDRVRVALDKSGYARAVQVIGTPPAPVTAMQHAATRAETGESAPADRETRIMREAVLNTAAAILASGGRATDVGAVLELATALEGWVTR